MSPRMAVTSDGTSSATIPVSETRMRSQARRSACSPRKASIVGEPDSSSPSTKNLTFTGRRPSAASRRRLGGTSEGRPRVLSGAARGGCGRRRRGGGGLGGGVVVGGGGGGGGRPPAGAEPLGVHRGLAP